MGSSGGGDTTTIQKTEPPKWAMPGIRQSLYSGKQLLDEGGFSADPYAGPRVAPWGQASSMAYEAIKGMGSNAGLPTGALQGMTGVDPRVQALARHNSQLGGMSDANPALTAMSGSNPLLAAMSRGNPGVAGLAGADPRLAAMSGADPRLAALGNGNPGLAAMGNVDPRLAGMSSGDPRLQALARSDPRLAGMAGGDARLSGMTSGNEIYRDLDKVKQNALGSAVPAAVSMFSGNGMTDSSAAMDTVGRAATEAVAPIDYGAWQSAQDRRLSAIGQDNSTRLQAMGQDASTRMQAAGMDNATRLQAMDQDAQRRMQAYGQNDATRMQAIGQDASTRMNAMDQDAQRRLQAYGQNDATRLQAMGQDSDTRLNAMNQDAQRRMQAIGQDQSTRLGALGLDASTRLGAFGQLPDYLRASYLPSQMLAGAGADYNAHHQQGIDANMAKYYEGQNQKRDNLLGYSGLVGNMAGFGGSGSTTGPSGQPSTAARLAGAGLGGLGTYGALAGMGLGGPLAIGGGVLAGLMGAL
jgi:hypothetical protein